MSDELSPMSKAFHEWLSKCPVNWMRLSVSDDVKKEATYNFWENE
jgi:hypothetical protein